MKRAASSAEREIQGNAGSRRDATSHADPNITHDPNIADQMLYAVSHDDSGAVELTVFEAGGACCVTLSKPLAEQLARLLTDPA